MRPVVSALILAVVSWLPVCAWAQGVFSLDEQTIRSRESNPFPALAVRLDEMKGLPAELPKSLNEGLAAAFTMRVAGKSVVLVVEARENARLYVDLDQDGSLADERPITGHREEFLEEFGPITLAVPGSDGKLAVHFCVSALVNDGRVYRGYVFPGKCRKGAVRLGGVDYKIVLADADANGRYNEPCASFDGDYSKVQGDCIAIDLDGNGAFDPLLETCPLSKTIRVRGVCYELAVLPDGSKVRLRPVTPEFELGVLDTGCAESELVLFSPELGLIRLGGGQGKWQLPSGEYTLMDSHLMSRQAGATWLLRRKWAEAERPTHTITAGETLTMRLGLPLRLASEVSFNKKSRTANVLFSVIGAGGEKYVEGAERSGQEVEAEDVKLKILDKNGRTLDSGAFQYG